MRRHIGRLLGVGRQHLHLVQNDIRAGIGNTLADGIATQLGWQQQGGFIQSASSMHAIRGITQMPLSTGNPRVVVLGTGWAAARLAHDLDTRKYDLTVSPSAVIVT